MRPVMSRIITWFTSRVVIFKLTLPQVSSRPKCLVKTMRANCGNGSAWAEASQFSAREYIGSESLLHRPRARNARSANLSSGAHAVEAQRGVSLHESAEFSQGKELFTGIESLFVFHDDYRHRPNQRGIGEGAEGLSVYVLHAVRRVEEDDVRGGGFALHAPDGAGQFLLKDCEAAGDTETFQILPNQFCGRPRRVDEICLFSAAAEGLDPHGSGAGEQINPDGTLKGGGVACSEHVEQSLAQTVGGGTKIDSAQ